jgi:CubicO group peptidase (beta-lactamase class C family)
MIFSLRFVFVAVSSFLLFVVASYSQPSSSPAGRWEGVIQLPGQVLAISVELVNAGGTWSGTIDIPAQGAHGLPLEKLAIEPPKVRFAIGGIPGAPTFDGTLVGDSITGAFMQGGASLSFRLGRQSEAERHEVEAATTAALDSIRSFLPKALKQWNVPGLAIAIVKGGKVILSEGFGYRDVEGKLPVTPNTLFAIGSSTKAFTAYILGTLVADNKLDWDEPVITYLPEFKLKDEYATKHITARDLLTHVSGLPRHDLLWYGSSLSRRELFDRLQYLEPTADLRERWQYQNLMFMTAGYLAEQITSKSWETLVRERIFQPLGMSSSNVSIDALKQVSDRAVGYNEEKKVLKRMEYRNIDAIGPAGAINSNAVDMAHWVMLQLGSGKYGDTQLLPKEVMATLHQPQVVMPGGLSSSSGEILFNLYAMGWMEHAYRGRLLVQHGGNIDGFSAMVSFMPKEDLGMVILTNANGTPLPTVAMYTIYDRLLGYSNVDWNADALAKAEKGDSLATMIESTETEDVARVPNTRPSHRLPDYAGEFEHPAYGVVAVREVRDRLEATYNGMTAPLEHYHYDVFVTGGESVMKDVKLQFRTDMKGDIASVVTLLEPSVDPIEFTRRAPAALSDTTALKRYVGDYDLAGQTLRVHLVGSKLITSFAGQQDQELVPYKEGEFTLKDARGYSLRFEPKEGAVTRVVIIQPNGTFTAKKK